MSHSKNKLLIKVGLHKWSWLKQPSIETIKSWFDLVDSAIVTILRLYLLPRNLRCSCKFSYRPLRRPLFMAATIELAQVTYFPPSISPARVNPSIHSPRQQSAITSSPWKSSTKRTGRRNASLKSTRHLQRKSLGSPQPKSSRSFRNGSETSPTHTWTAVCISDMRSLFLRSSSLLGINVCLGNVCCFPTDFT